MATQLVLVQSLGVRVLPPEREAAPCLVAGRRRDRPSLHLAAAPAAPIHGSGVSAVIQAPFV